MTNEQLSQKIDELSAMVAGLVKNLPQAPAPQPEIPPEAKINRLLGGESGPVSPEFRQVVDEVLNKKFGVHLMTTTSGIKFTIIVPKEYSWEIQNGKVEFDVRPKIIPTYSVEGLAAAKEWCEKVFSTFGERTRVLITSDRIEESKNNGNL